MTNPRTDHPEADRIDGDFFIANPQRLHLLRPALPGEVDAHCRAGGMPRSLLLPPDTVAWAVVRRDGDEIVRTYWPIPSATSAEMEQARDEVTGDEDFAHATFQGIQDGRRYDPAAWFSTSGVN